MFTVLAEDYKKAMEEMSSLEKEKNDLDASIEELKSISVKQEKEYLSKERQIATYLECRKTFFGRVKYFFKLKKKKKEDTEKQEDNNVKEIEKNKEEITNTNFTIREFYTIDDIVKIYKELDLLLEKVKNLKLDYNALENRTQSMNIKIQNANLYIEEIDKHEKSIFEFWKFANKDEKLMLNQGSIVQNVNKRTIEKVYSYDEDREEIGDLIDKIQRSYLSKDDTDSIYIAGTELLKVLNNIDNDEIVDNSLKQLKEELENNRVLFNTDKIDIFGEMANDNTKIKTLGDKKHRETKKDKLKILEITKDTNLEEYKDKLKKVLDNVKRIINKQKKLISIPAYIALDRKEELEGLKVLNLNLEEVIKEAEDNKKNCII